MKRALSYFAAGAIFATTGLQSALADTKPNVIVLIADQWRAQAFGYAGDPNVKTPNFDRLAAESVNLSQAISTVPVCSPTRASLLTGQHALTHGVFLNDVPLNPEATTIAKVFMTGGYATGAIGKWHVDGHGRSTFIPPERRQGFDFWRVNECTHSYTNSVFYGDSPEKQVWGGYDAVEQIKAANDYVREQTRAKRPFLLWLAWGPPHDPYLTAPEKYRAMYKPEELKLRPNVPATMEKSLRLNLAGYYAHCTALDDALGLLLATLQETGAAAETILLFTADHGDMLGSQGAMKKQRPFEESARVPMLVHWPNGLKPHEAKAAFQTEDVMPTLLGLAGLKVPASVEGLDFSGYLRGGKDPGDGAALISCPSPFGEFQRQHGGKEYRGVRTEQATYVRDLDGPWLLFDDLQDPYQQTNLVGQPEAAALQAEMEQRLQAKLRAARDDFRPGAEYVAKWNWPIDERGTVPIHP